MLALEENRIYQGNLILVNQNYPVRCTRTERELRPVFAEQPDILMEGESARMLKKLLQEISAEIPAEKQKISCRTSFRTGDEKKHTIVGVSGYRTKEEQTAIFEDSLRENGRVFTEKYVALPGHSEHQTGLAIDLAEHRPEIDFICPEFPYEGICQKFREKMAEFGFVERYSKEKQKITGIGAEPWHFRYVGKIHAELMQKQGMALEEYIQWLKEFDLRFHPLTIYRNHRQIRIGYVKAQGRYTRIEGLEELTACTRIGYVKLCQANQQIAWKRCKETEQDRLKTGIQISGNNVDGFIFTCVMMAGQNGRRI